MSATLQPAAVQIHPLFPRTPNTDASRLLWKLDSGVASERSIDPSYLLGSLLGFVA